ncbi:hypothetical protein KSP39_PZI022653 [Platanthera zijinensis]|uniref:Uncharacterized protein n=1 Tax=Platanthera zijinensis TaxID=2320716 RepID=A0AAP0AW88_9ASPA
MRALGPQASPYFYPMSPSSSKLKVRFLVDKEQERVVFAEAGGEFVDVLFSFLALPLGRIGQLFEFTMGSLDALYQSVQRLDIKHLQTEACKEMLLNPRSAIALQSQDLKINIMHDQCPRIAYTCRDIGCLIQAKCCYTFTSKKSLCSRCGKPMDNILNLPKKASEEVGVFVNDTSNFMITDDLQVMPTSLSKAFFLLEDLQIDDAGILEERVVYFGTNEVLDLLDRSFVCNNVFTDVCFPDFNRENGDFYLPSEKEIAADEAEDTIVLKLFLNVINNTVLYAEVEEDFINLLFSFLTFPLGSIFGLFSDGVSSFGGCIGNLYSSMENMDSNCFKSEICRNMLLIPKLSAFYGIKNSMLELEEIKPIESTVLISCVNLDNGYKTCTFVPCAHELGETDFIEQNPKSANGATNNGGAFVVGSNKFIVSDRLEISPLSAISTILDEMDSPISNLVEVEVFVGRGEARSLLSAMMISTMVLTDVFYHQLKYRW